jgi:hypothetical protein
MPLMKEHPFTFGVGVGAVGLLVWFKRGVFVGWFRRMTSHFHGFGDMDALIPALKTAPGDAAPIAVRQIRRYAFAAAQDKSPVVGLTHASYALVLLDTVEEMLGKDALARISGVEPARMRAFIAAQQDRHGEVLRKCDPYMLDVLKMEEQEKLSGSGGLIEVGAAPRGA